MPKNLQRSGPPVTVFAALVGSLPLSRIRFADWLQTAQVGDDVARDLEVVFSELTANAVTGSAASSDDVDVRADIDDGMLTLDVSNHIGESGRLPPSAPDVGDALRRDGRGLLITRSSMHSVDVRREHLDRLVVRCCRRVAPAS